MWKKAAGLAVIGMAMMAAAAGSSTYAAEPDWNKNQPAWSAEQQKNDRQPEFEKKDNGEQSGYKNKKFFQQDKNGDKVKDHYKKDSTKYKNEQKKAKKDIKKAKKAEKKAQAKEDKKKQAPEFPWRAE